MVKGCAVPKCKTGYQSFKQKCSVFRVPRNNERYKKWLNAIPGLRQSQYVCEKHFEERCIVRYWRKTDADGRLIAESAYVHPKLSEFAIPTIFEEDVKSSTGFAVNQCPEPSINKVHCAMPFSKFRFDSECADRITDKQFSSKQSLQQEVVSSKNCMDLAMETSMEEKFTPLQELFQQEITSSNKFNGQEHRPSVSAAVPNMESASTCKIYFEISDKTLYVHSVKAPAKVDNSREKTSVSIPKLWAITESSMGEEQRIIFSYIVMKKENGVDVPVIAKSIVLSSKRSLQYSVYGRAINSKQCKLEVSLNDVTLLPGILEKFKNMNICIGIGAVNVFHLSLNEAFEDAVGRWHHNDCPLVWSRKRCDGCTKMRKRILKKEMRLNENRRILILSRASNPTDEQKLLALRRKVCGQRRLKNQAEQHGKLLFGLSTNH